MITSTMNLTIQYNLVIHHQISDITYLLELPLPANQYLIIMIYSDQ